MVLAELIKNSQFVSSEPEGLNLTRPKYADHEPELQQCWPVTLRAEDGLVREPA